MIIIIEKIEYHRRQIIKLEEGFRRNGRGLPLKRRRKGRRPSAARASRTCKERGRKVPPLQRSMRRENLLLLLISPRATRNSSPPTTPSHFPLCPWPTSRRSSVWLTTRNRCPSSRRSDQPCRRCGWSRWRTTSGASSAWSSPSATSIRSSSGASSWRCTRPPRKQGALRGTSSASSTASCTGATQSQSRSSCGLRRPIAPTVVSKQQQPMSCSELAGRTLGDGSPQRNVRCLIQHDVLRNSNCIPVCPVDESRSADWSWPPIIGSNHHTNSPSTATMPARHGRKQGGNALQYTNTWV